MHLLLFKGCLNNEIYTLCSFLNINKDGNYIGLIKVDTKQKISSILADREGALEQIEFTLH